MIHEWISFTTLKEKINIFIFIIHCFKLYFITNYFFLKEHVACYGGEINYPVYIYNGGPFLTTTIL